MRIGPQEMRTCKTSIVHGPQKSGFCIGIAARFWDKNDVGQKRCGLTTPIWKKRAVSTIQKHEGPSVSGPL
jgi:hypothetical protein